MANNNDPRRNASGCLDLTAYEAIRNVDREIEADARFEKFLQTVFNIADLAGLHIEERLVVKDKKTGKVWR
jgi:hypothetical protein